MQAYKQLCSLRFVSSIREKWKISGKADSEYLIHKESSSSSFAPIDPMLSQWSSVLINMNIESLLVWFSWLTPAYMGCTEFSQWLTHLYFKYQLLQCSWKSLQPANLLAYRNCIRKPWCSKLQQSSSLPKPHHHHLYGYALFTQEHFIDLI